MILLHVKEDECLISSYSMMLLHVKEHECLISSYSMILLHVKEHESVETNARLEVLLLLHLNVAFFHH